VRSRVLGVRENITYAFLHCTSEPDRESIPRIKRFLTKLIPLAMHPMLLQILIMDLETDLTLGDDEGWMTEIKKVENGTRQKPNAAKSLDLLDLDLPSIVQRLNGCSVFLSLNERESETVLLHLDQARRVISDLELTSPTLRQSSNMLIRHIETMCSDITINL
jgi:hypothetical protein